MEVVPKAGGSVSGKFKVGVNGDDISHEPIGRGGKGGPWDQREVLNQIIAKGGQTHLRHILGANEIQSI